MINNLKKGIKFISLLLKSGGYRAFQINKRVSKIIPKVNVFDIGASYFPHIKFKLFLDSHNTNWYAIDPNVDNLAYIKNWNFKAKVNKIGQALSLKGGDIPFYKTKIDSGSSNLEFNFNKNIKHRISFENLLPITKTNIKTVKLADIVETIDNPSAPFIFKLDTQGTELNILKSLNSKVFSDKVVSIEIETNLSLTPLNKKSASFNDVVNFFQKLDFEIAKIDVINYLYPKLDSNIEYHNIPKECDLVLIKKISKAIVFNKIFKG